MHEFLSRHFGDLANVVACFGVWFLCQVFGVRLRMRCKERCETEKSDTDPDKRQRAEGWMLLSWAFHCWTVAWLCWVLLYAVKLMSLYWQPLTEHLLPVLIVLSDLNSAFLILAFVGLSRGSAASYEVCRAAQFLVLLVVLIVDKMYLYMGYMLSDSPHRLLFLLPWSVGLSMFAPFLLGRGFKMRYGTNTAWVIGCLYAMFQPLAYAAAFSPYPMNTATVRVRAGATVSPHFLPHVKTISKTAQREVWKVSREARPKTSEHYWLFRCSATDVFIARTHRGEPAGGSHGSAEFSILNHAPPFALRYRGGPGRP